MARIVADAERHVAEAEKVASTLAAPVGEMERFQKVIDDLAAPINDAIKNSALSKLNPSTAKLLASYQKEWNKTMSPLKDLRLDSAISNLQMAGLPPQGNPNFPPLPKPMMVELSQPMPVKVELPDSEPPEPQPWWKQGWFWGAIGSVLVLINIIITLV